MILLTCNSSVDGIQLIQINISHTGRLEPGENLVLYCYIQTTFSDLRDSLVGYWGASPLPGTTYSRMLGEVLVVEQRINPVRASMSLVYTCYGRLHSKEQNVTVRNDEVIELVLQGKSKAKFKGEGIIIILHIIIDDKIYPQDT